MKLFFLPGDSPDAYFYGTHASWIGAALFMVLAKFFGARSGLTPFSMLMIAGAFGALASAYAAGLWRVYRSVAEDEMSVASGEKLARDPKPVSLAPFIAGSIPVMMTLFGAWFVYRVSRG